MIWMHQSRVQKMTGILITLYFELFQKLTFKGLSQGFSKTTTFKQVFKGILKKSTKHVFLHQDSVGDFFFNRITGKFRGVMGDIVCLPKFASVQVQLKNLKILRSARVSTSPYVRYIGNICTIMCNIVKHIKHNKIMLKQCTHGVKTTIIQLRRQS